MNAPHSGPSAITTNVSTSPLLAPLPVRGITLRNRAVSTAHGAFPSYWNPTDTGEDYINYQRRRAAGGVGLIILQYLQVEPTGGHWPTMYLDRLGRMADAVHAEGGHVLLQLTSFGAQGSSEALIGQRPIWSFSADPSPLGEATHAMTGDEILHMIDAHARAASVARQAGLDGVELQGGHGYLVQQSYSPWGNRRTDEWGEPLAFTKAVLAALRTELGDDLVLSFRATLDDLRDPADGGLSRNQLLDIARLLVAHDTIDILNNTVGSRFPDYALADPGSYRQPLGQLVELGSQLRNAINAAIPVIGVGRVTTPEQANEALASGKCDLVGLTRAHIVDPDFIRKARQGISSRIRPCVGSNECVDRRLIGLSMQCLHNTDLTGKIHDDDSGGDLVVHADARQKVVVIGAGPAGLKAAEAAALRGHQVVLIERETEVGGALRHVRRTRAAELFGAIEWLSRRLGTLGVDLRMATEATPQLLTRLAPDLVVVATGSEPDTSSLPAQDDASVVSEIDALYEPTGHRILVIDRHGGMQGGLVAERLAAQGKQVCLVTPFASFAPTGGYSVRTHLIQALRTAGVDIITGTEVTSVRARNAELRRDGTTLDPVQADTFVLVRPSPLAVTAAQVEQSGIPRVIVGDALAPRSALRAFAEGAKAADRLPFRSHQTIVPAAPQPTTPARPIGRP